MNNKPTVTVAVSAYNEEENIVPFLESILKQKEDGFILQNIWIHSDGSTDKTVNLVKKFKSKKIKIWEHKERKGKSTWLNNIYSDLKSDILVQTDADVVFAHPLVIRNLIGPMIKNGSVGMCGGNPMPVEGDLFWEKVVYAAFQPYLEFRSTIRGGDNAFSAIGQILAYRREVVKQIEVPFDMVTNDIFTYFYALKLGWKYKFVKDAVVLFKSPERMTDFIKQNTRFEVGYYRMFDYFDRQVVEYEMSIPETIKIKTMLRQFVKFPLHLTVFFIFKVYCKINAVNMKNKLNAKWPIAITTKKLIV